MGILFCKSKDEILSEKKLERKALEDIYYALNGSSYGMIIIWKIGYLLNQ